MYGIYFEGIYLSINASLLIMCSIYSNTNPVLYDSKSRSIRISKVVTSIKLENVFWEILEHLAHDSGLSLNQLITELYEEIYATRGEINNFSSFLRVTCMKYQANKKFQYK